MRRVPQPLRYVFLRDLFDFSPPSESIAIEVATEVATEVFGKTVFVGLKSCFNTVDHQVGIFVCRPMRSDPSVTFCQQNPRFGVICDWTFTIHQQDDEFPFGT